MPTVLVQDVEGAEHAVSVTEGQTLLEAMLDIGLPVKATCFGCCNCSTCHVEVDAAWADRLPPREEQEIDVLEGVESPTPRSRLACQIFVTGELDGLRVCLTPDTIP